MIFHSYVSLPEGIVLGCYSTLHFGLVRPPRCQWKFLSKNGWALHPLFVENSQVIIVWLCLTNSLTDQPVGRVWWHSSSSRQTLPCDAVQSLALALRTTGQGLFDLFWFLMLYVIFYVYFPSHWSQKSASWGIPSDICIWLMWLCSRPSGRLPTESVPRCSRTGCSCNWRCYGKVQRIAPEESRHGSCRHFGNHNKLQQCTCHQKKGEACWTTSDPQWDSWPRKANHVISL